VTIAYGTPASLLVVATLAGSLSVLLPSKCLGLVLDSETFVGREEAGARLDPDGRLRRDGPGACVLVKR
jgi:hypothetical protein